ncbi:hypothetical protein IWW37_003655 [Coemansia sp. RSA 2050]|nr:hypothetical protein IWW37_003655 [Coemansia sp. RSA 2050]KAJ2732745.1 hypothetical protein IW152_003548 [Coemansia sp. BCRC 34962]
MNGRGPRDNANFLDRIKNVDVLKSPYPRHLAPAARTPVAAQSARPFHGRGNTLYSPVRPIPAPAPAPTHTFSCVSPVRPSPVVQSGTLAASPVGSATYTGPAGFGYYPSAVHHRSIPDYPGSVQPVRGPSYTSPEQRHVPGSSRPARFSGAGTPGDAISLYRWHVGIDPVKRAVIVLGSYDKPSGETVNRHSSAIKKSLGSHMLLSMKDAVYMLVGPVNEEAMHAKGFPVYLIRAFSQGFPANWEKLTSDFMDQLASPQHSGATRPSVRSPDFLHHGPLSLMRNDSSEGYYQSGVGSDRFGVIAEDEEVPEVDEPPTSSGLSGSFRDLAFDRTARPMEAPSTRPHDSSSSSVYRSGSALFSTGRFAKPDVARAADLSQLRVVAEPVLEHPDVQSDDGFDVLAQNDPVIDDEEAAPELETAVPVHESDTLGKANAGGEASIEHMPANTEACVSESAAASSDSESADITKDQPATKGLGTATASDATTPRRRSQMRIVESSDESIPNAATGVPATKSRMATRRAGTRLSAGAATSLRTGSPADTKAARRASLNIPTKPTLEATPKATSSLSASRLKGNSSAPKKRPIAKAQRSSALVAVAATPLSELPAEEDHLAAIPRIVPNDKDMGETPTKRRGRAWRQARVAEKQAEGIQPAAEDATPPAATETDEAPEVEESPVGDTHADNKAEVPIMVTPKRKIGRNYFKYNEPKQNTAITRSGRKIHRPKEWWANAQERLSEGHKESNFKYRWGSGDAVIIKGDKRIRLSDYYLEDGAQGSSLFDDSSDAKERGDDAESHSEAGASERQHR